LAVVSHDLRAPLNNVLLCSNLISKSVGDSVAVERFVGMINRTSRQMEKLISDLLDVSEMEMGRVRIEKRSCDIRSVIDPVRDIFAEQSKSIQFDVSCPVAVPELMIDPDRMIQVMSNLVGNALKFTPSGGRVSLNVS